MYSRLARGQCGKGVEKLLKGVWKTGGECGFDGGGDNYHRLSTQKLTDIRVVFRNYLLTLHVVNSVLITWLNHYESTVLYVDNCMEKC